jgi:hypothetical protein
MRQRDWFGLCVVALVWAVMVAYRQVYLEPRVWGTLCVAAAPPLACLPRAGLIWLQHYYLLGIASLALGLWGFAWRGGFAAQLGAVLFGIAAIENYNATWGAIGAALGAWAWLRRAGWLARRPLAASPVLAEERP